MVLFLGKLLQMLIINREMDSEKEAKLFYTQKQRKTENKYEMFFVDFFQNISLQT